VHGKAPSIIVALALVALVTAGWRLHAEPSRSVWDGVYTLEQAGRGEAIYARECVSCHGPKLNDGAETPLADEAFRTEWTGFTANDLFERISKTMPDSDPGYLSKQEYVDVLAHIFHANQYPAGNSELDGSADALKQIRIEPASPKGQ
jgi:cytochrome c